MNGKYSDAYRVLKRIAKANKKTVPERYELFMLNNNLNGSESKQSEINEISDQENDKKPEQVDYYSKESLRPTLLIHETYF